MRDSGAVAALKGGLCHPCKLLTRPGQAEQCRSALEKKDNGRRDRRWAGERGRRAAGAPQAGATHPPDEDSNAERGAVDALPRTARVAADGQEAVVGVLQLR